MNFDNSTNPVLLINLSDNPGIWSQKQALRIAYMLVLLVSVQHPGLSGEQRDFRYLLSDGEREHLRLFK